MKAPEMNKVAWCGNVASDPKPAHVFANGDAVRHLFAINNKLVNTKNGPREISNAMSIDIWASADDMAKLAITKGTAIEVRGELATDSWESNGVKQYKTVIRCHADGFKVLGGGVAAEAVENTAELSAEDIKLFNELKAKAAAQATADADDEDIIF